jgi:hypothetical protein
MMVLVYPFGIPISYFYLLYLDDDVVGLDAVPVDQAEGHVDVEPLLDLVAPLVDQRGRAAHHALAELALRDQDTSRSG